MQTYEVQVVTLLVKHSIIIKTWQNESQYFKIPPFFPLLNFLILVFSNCNSTHDV